MSQVTKTAKSPISQARAQPPKRPAASAPAEHHSNPVKPFVPKSRVTTAAQDISKPLASQADKTRAAVFPYPPEARTPEQVLHKLAAMRDHFSGLPKPEKNYGVFPTVYLEMSKALVNQVAQYRREGKTRQAQVLSDFLTPFANEYFKAFSAHQAQTGHHPNRPTGAPTGVAGPWARHFAEVSNPKATMGGLVGSAIAAHLLYDLPRLIATLDTAQAPGWQVVDEADYQKNRADFLDYGSAFGDSVTSIASALQKYHGPNEVSTLAQAFGLVGLDRGSATLVVGELRQAAFHLGRLLRTTEVEKSDGLTSSQLDFKISELSTLFTTHLDSLVHGVSKLDIINFPQDIFGLGQALGKAIELRLLSR